jgi:stress-induced morphogen
MTKEQILNRLHENFTDSEIEVQDMTGQSNHFNLLIISNDFKSVSLIKRHKMIHSIFKEELTTEIHAFQIKALTLAEWGNKK